MSTKFSTTSAIRKNRQSGSSKVIIVLFVLGAILAVLFVVGALPKLKDKRSLNAKEEENASAVPAVQTITVKPADLDESAKMPCNLGAMQFATIYARVDGYLRGRLVDIGDHVKAGELLAEIDTPTVDEEISQAQADLLEAKAQEASAMANLKGSRAEVESVEADIKKVKTDQSYAAVTADRWGHMADEGAVSLQSRDEKMRALGSQNAALEAVQAKKRVAQQQVQAAMAQVKVAQAGVAAKKAILNKYKAQQSFKHVLAPFDGVIVSRKVDPGALITAGSQSQNQEIMQLAKLDVLRSYINVPQSISQHVKPGQTAELTVTSYPGRKFLGTVTNVSGGIDPQTRTRQAEIKIDNFDHALMPGMYAEAKLTAVRSNQWVQVPSSTVIPKNNTMQVVLVKDGKAHFQEVVLGRDFGDTIEIKSGLTSGDTVIGSPPDDLREGDAVQPAKLAAAEDKGEAK